MVKRKDVALRAGVSETTVSYVLNNSKNVTQEVRRRVLEAVKELDYRPNLVARGLASKQTNHVAMLVDNLKNPYYCELLEGVQSLASEEKYIVSVIATDNSNKESVLELASRGLDGILLALGSLDIKAFISKSIPTVYLGEYITIDFSAATFDIVGTLYRKGHRKIAFLSGLPISDPGHIRYITLMKAFRHYGIERLEKLIIDALPFGRTDEEAGEEAMKKLLDRNEKFTAVFAINDLMALGACRVLHDNGFCVPDDVSVIGCDNIKLLSSIYPSLSSIDTHPFETGRAMMRSLIEVMRKRPRQKKVIIANFIPRESISTARTTI